MKTNQDYKNAALAALKGNWAPAVLMVIIYTAIVLLVNSGQFYAGVMEGLNGVAPFSEVVMLVIELASIIATLLIISPLVIGIYNSFRLLLERGDADLIRNSFTMGFENYGHVLWGYLLMEIKIVLWALLLIVPGIIKSFSYAMTPFILVEHPEMSASKAIAASNAMMKGHKFDLFYLYLSFIGWIILSVLTCGIGSFWLAPYMQTAMAAFYCDLRDEALAAE